MSACRRVCCRPWLGRLFFSFLPTWRPVRCSLSDAIEGGNHRETRCLESIAKERIEFGQLVCSVFLVLNRKIFPVTAYFPAAHLERFGIANIARMQDV